MASENCAHHICSEVLSIGHETEVDSDYLYSDRFLPYTHSLDLSTKIEGVADV